MPNLPFWSWQVDLEAGRELRAIAAFGIAAAQGLDRDPVSLELAVSLPQRLGSSTAASHRVLGESTLVEEDAGMTPPDRQNYPSPSAGWNGPCSASRAAISSSVASRSSLPSMTGQEVSRVITNPLALRSSVMMN